MSSLFPFCFLFIVLLKNIFVTLERDNFNMDQIISTQSTDDGNQKSYNHKSHLVIGIWALLQIDETFYLQWQSDEQSAATNLIDVSP